MDRRKLRLLIIQIFVQIFVWAVHNIEVILGNLLTEHGVLGCPFDVRENKSLCELVFAERSLGLHGQHTVYKHQRVAVAVVVLLVKTGKKEA